MVFGSRCLDFSVDIVRTESGLCVDMEKKRKIYFLLLGFSIFKAYKVIKWHERRRKNANQ